MSIVANDEKTIVVNNISAQVELAHLKELFECCGTISNAKMVTAPTGRQQALITFTESAHAKAATFLTDTPLGDTKLQVSLQTTAMTGPDPGAYAAAYSSYQSSPPPLPTGSPLSGMGASGLPNLGNSMGAAAAAAAAAALLQANGMPGAQPLPPIPYHRPQAVPINVAAAQAQAANLPAMAATAALAAGVRTEQSMGMGMMLPMLGGIPVGGSAGALPASAIPGYIGGGAALNPMASGPNAPPAFLVQQNLATIATGGLVMGPRGGIDTASLLAQQKARDEILRTISVNNIASIADEDMVRKYFNTCGHVSYVKFTGATEDGSKIAAVEFSSQEGAKAAIALSGHTMMDRKLTIAQAATQIVRDSRASDERPSRQADDAMRRVREAQLRIATKVGEPVSAATGVAALNAATDPSAAAGASSSSSSRRSSRSRSRSRDRDGRRRSRSRSRDRSDRRSSRSSRGSRRSRSRSRDRRDRSRSRERRGGSSSYGGRRPWTARAPAQKKKEQPDTSNMFWDGFQWNLKIPGVLESRGPIPMPGQRFGLH